MLLVGRDDRSMVAILRSLGEAGIAVDVAWHDPHSIVPRSRYCKKTHALANPDLTGANWLGPLSALLAQERYNLVLPADDPATLALAAHRGELEMLARLALPNERTLNIAFDKLATWDLARSLGLPVPRQVAGSVSASLAPAVHELGWPIVLKPRMSWKFGCQKWEHCVKLASTPAELSAHARALSRFDEVLLQQYVSGCGVGVEVLAWRGEVLLAFQHERLHESPRGGSTYRRGVPLDPELVAAAHSIAAVLELSGVAMVEFRREHASRRWFLIEVNARFWGSLPLAVRSGADFPLALYELWVEGRRTFGAAYAPYRTARNLRRDVWWLRENRRTVAMEPALARVPTIKLLRELGALLRFRESVDAWSWRDPWPGIIETGALAREIGRLARKRLLRAPRTWLALRRGRRARAKIAAVKRVLFVCKGNLCRSPFAERWLAARLKGEVEVSSAGTWQQAGRASPAEAEVAAAAHGIDLAPHRSRCVSAEDLERAEVVLVFDFENARALARLFPDQRHKLFLLGAVAGQAPVSFADPWGADYERFASVFERIARALELIWVPEGVRKTSPA